MLDNGSGRNADVLRMALQFGNGTRLDPSQHNGIGRFGMGLPASSISQCTRVDVWTWQNGVENAIHTYLDLHEIREQRLGTVPQPRLKEIEPLWRAMGEKWGDSGTLVVWSHLDRCRWSSARALIRNTEDLIGRMYRKFLDGGKVRIRFASANVADPDGTLEENYALPNDPGYLMAVTSCPKPFDKTPMFQPWADKNATHEATFHVPYKGQRHTVTVRFSLAKDEARAGFNPGRTPHGQHAKSNVGVSIVRAGRELELDQGFVLQYDPRERWWGVEVDFPPALDDLFGVSNNKQSARHFADLAKLDIESLTQNGVTINEAMAQMAADEDPRGPLLEIANKIKNSLTQMRSQIKLQTQAGKDADTPERSTRPRAEARATEATKLIRDETGVRGQSDADEDQPAEERRETLKAEMLQTGAAPAEAERQSRIAVDLNLKYVFTHADLDNAAFFSVRSVGGAVMITLNTNHPAYENLVEVLEEDVEDADEATLRDRLASAGDGLKLLLMAWARYEDELPPDGPQQQRARDARNDWGRIARRFLARDE